MDHQATAGQTSESMQRLPTPLAFSLASRRQPTVEIPGGPALKPTANDENSRGNTTYVDD